MLNYEVVMPVVIAICIGMSFIGINHYNIFKVVKKSIYVYNFVAVVFYVIYWALFSTGEITFKTCVDFFFEVFILGIPYSYSLLMEYIGALIEKEKGKNK